MSSLCLRPGIRFGPYPERTDERAPALDEFLQRQVGAWVRWPGAVQRRARRFLDAVNAAEPALREADDAGLARVTGDIRRELTRGGLVDEVSARAFALVREQSRRTLNMRHHDCQVIGGFAMLQGMLAEMETGEGKTLAVTLPAATAALAGIPVHVITVNDYLVTRDAALMGPLYRALGLSVGSVTQQLADPRQRRAAYASDVTYCCNKQLVFDYLRDRVAMGARRGRLQRMLDAVATEQSRPAPLILRGLAFGIVDEADSVLIDECRTPLILSRPGKSLYAPEIYRQALQFATGLQPQVDYAIDPKDRVVALTAAGRKALAAAAPAGDACWSATRRREELVRQALAAQHLFRRDEHYIVRDGKVQIIDASTGRLMPDRSWELGLHQMIESKEGCEITPATESIARITYQRFFRRYGRLAAATGTAREVAGELWSVYRLRVFTVPTHRPCRRVALPSRIHLTREDKERDIVARVREFHAMQRPVLIGTASVAASEHLSMLLAAAGLRHEVLNARQDAREAAIVAEAGRSGRITIATNMAGRGTDIRLHPGVAQAGGLHIIATERNESRRVDRQLAGRCARQGDPGSHEFVLSLDDASLGASGVTVLLALARYAWRRNPRQGARFAALLFRFVQRVTESRAARARGLLLRADKQLADMLAFTGHPE